MLKSPMVHLSNNGCPENPFRNANQNCTFKENKNQKRIYTNSTFPHRDNDYYCIMYSIYSWWFNISQPLVFSL